MLAMIFTFLIFFAITEVITIFVFKTKNGTALAVVVGIMAAVGRDLFGFSFFGFVGKVIIVIAIVTIIIFIFAFIKNFYSKGKDKLFDKTEKRRRNKRK